MYGRPYLLASDNSLQWAAGSLTWPWKPAVGGQSFLIRGEGFHWVGKQKYKEQKREATGGGDLYCVSLPGKSIIFPDILQLLHLKTVSKVYFNYEYFILFLFEFERGMNLFNFNVLPCVK